ncbi:hypothetical protein [Enterobacter sp. CP102]|uniref:hypothetical protein n=1 Tax=Enterobacter sp. CP102 TaxID=2976431 RepID=UPI00220BFFEF|nr:hypothetical protein [Enterobacter sp. CP102]UWM63536.1 hypothetical protein N1249_18645 [Enterobacter sp. CP102]
MADDIAAWYAEEHTGMDESDGIVQFMMHETYSTEEELETWHLRAWENSGAWECQRTQNETEATIAVMPAEWLPLVKDGETPWMIERNATAAGFMCETDYLRWRADNESTGQD